MKISSDTFYDHYPIREAGATERVKEVWRSPHAKNLQRVLLSWRSSQSERDQDKATQNIDLNEMLRVIDHSGNIDLDALAISFQRFSLALHAVHGLQLSEQHIAAAYGLFERRVEVMRSSSDRVLTAGLAAAAFVQAGIRVHLLGDDAYRQIVLDKLLPVFDYLEISLGQVKTGDSEDLRRANYQCDITLLSARECAMDFLRDSVNWPKRGNRAHRVVDRLVGRRSKHKSKIMSGLPCAIHLDAQAALIDNARAPIVLTQDAHPMHDVEELRRAIELSTSMELAKDYIYSGKELEIAYTQDGKNKIDAWAKEFGGIWSVPSAADLMIAIGLVVHNILRIDQHYRINNGLLEWLMPDSLIPGMRYYSKPFLTRVVELQQECAVTGQQEVVGRASYQHVFNRYIHLCGLSHASGQADAELADIYGLKTASQKPSHFTAQRSMLVVDQQAKVQYLINAIVQRDQSGLSILCLTGNEQSDQLREDLHSSGLVQHYFDNADAFSLAAQNFAAGAVVMLDTEVLASVAKAIWQGFTLPVNLMVCNRSVDWYEDALIDQFDLSAMQNVSSSLQVIAEDEEVFQNHSVAIIASLQKPLLQLGVLGQKLFQTLLELRIKSIHKQVAQESSRVRRNLLTHDQGMQSMLSFSGKGLYE